MISILSILYRYRDAVFGIFLLGIIAFTYTQTQEAKKVKAELVTEIANRKAYEQEVSGLGEQAYSLSITVDELKHSKDSINQKLSEEIRVSKLKDKNIERLVYLLNRVTRVDTIHFRDTLFVKDLKVDTILTSKFYTLDLKLRYPSTITVSPTFVDEEFMLFSYKRETVNPPNPFFLFRWFQKKQTLTVVDVKHSSPYIKTEKTRFVNIQK